MWSANASGVINSGSGWKSGPEMLEAGYETMFNKILIQMATLGFRY